MTDAFSAAVSGAIALLRALPRTPADATAAREQLRAFVDAHPVAAPEFLVDSPPGAEHADFDIYLLHPEGGTVALSFREDAGKPWFVDYSEHWAANYVLHVGSQRVTIQEAMFAMQYLSERDPGLMESLVRDALLTEFADSEPDAWLGEALVVSDEEVQAAADSFRHAHQLQSASDTHAWLEQMGWSMHRFRSVLASGVLVRRIEERLVAGRIEGHFAEHRADFDRVQVFRAVCGDATLAERLVLSAREVGLMTATQRVACTTPSAGLRGELLSTRAHALDDLLRTAVAGAIGGPTKDAGTWVVTQVLARDPATTLDSSTRSAVRERLVRDWAADRARTVPVRWNWT